MPVQTSKSGLANRFAKRKGKEIEVDVIGGGGGLPAGIEGGTATLTKCVIDTYKKGNDVGKEYFMIQGVVTSPEEFQGMHIAGNQVIIMEALHDTPNKKRKTVDEHIDFVRGMVKDLGLDPDDFDNLGTSILDGTVQAALIEAGVQFRFRTWKGEVATTGPYKGKEPMVNIQYRGAAGPAASNGAATSYTQDDTEGAVNTEEEELETEEPDAEAEGDELSELVAKCESDPKAQATLRARALKAGVSPKDFDNTGTWDEAGRLVRDAEGGGEEEAASSFEAGGVCKYKDAKDKKAKPTEHDILAMSKDDIIELGTKADGDNEDAQNLLREFAEAFGDVEEPEAWSDWAEAIGNELSEECAVLRRCDTNVLVVNVPHSSMLPA